MPSLSEVRVEPIPRVGVGMMVAVLVAGTDVVVGAGAGVTGAQAVMIKTIISELKSL
jgi:hypothetical protein